MTTWHDLWGLLELSPSSSWGNCGLQNLYNFDHLCLLNRLVKMSQFHRILKPLSHRRSSQLFLKETLGSKCLFNYFYGHAARELLKINNLETGENAKWFLIVESKKVFVAWPILCIVLFIEVMY